MNVKDIKEEEQIKYPFYQKMRKRKILIRMIKAVKKNDKKYIFNP